MRPEEEFLARCTRAGSAPVHAPRLQIVGAAFELSEPVTYEALQEMLASRGIVSSRPTIYRAMHTLTRVGLMIQPDPQQGAWMFSYDGGKLRNPP